MGKRDAGKDGHRETLIGAGTVLDGTFDIEYDVRVDGTLRGKRLATQQRLTVGPEGQVQADCIEVAEALIDGQVDGRLVARDVEHAPLVLLPGVRSVQFHDHRARWFSLVASGQVELQSDTGP